MSDGVTQIAFESNRRALDLFCGAGGVSVGLRRAGFEVVGVDIADQPRYPFEFIRADALSVGRWLPISAWSGSFDFVWASPPCQHYSDLAYRNGNADEHPDLIGPTRELLEATGLPYVIENVEGAPLRDPVRVCGTALGLSTGGLPNGGGYRLRRHRYFEANFELFGTSCACHADKRPVIDVSGGGPTHAPRLDGKGGRTYKGTVAEKRAAMGINWMTGAELVEAIPPAYAEVIGSQVPTRQEIAA